jgi:hypothetical protein
MNTSTTVALITVSSLSLIVSSATLVTMLVGAKKMQAELDDMKKKTSKTVSKFKTALEALDL